MIEARKESKMAIECGDVNSEGTPLSSYFLTKIIPILVKRFSSASKLACHIVTVGLCSSSLPVNALDDPGYGRQICIQEVPTALVATSVQ
ncbi:hypothetical protein FQA39_LY12134 [Lamprigera yunnana]|nr:hypothetical protein FQA39_LY12134 [Lamprigera yunnana]